MLVLIKLLIEPVWNRNTLAGRLSSAGTRRQAFNRTSMESKHVMSVVPCYQFASKLLLIEPVWNRN